MIQPPGVVEPDLQWREQSLHFASQRRITWSGILHLKEFSGKSAKIVDGSRRSGNGYANLRNKPMRRDRQDRFRPGDGAAYAIPRMRKVIVKDGIHWVAVTKKYCGEYVGHDASAQIDLGMPFRLHL